MTYEVLFRLEAERDIEDAALWYHKQRHGLGMRFIDAIHDTLLTVANHPMLYPIVHKRIRRALVHKFPFCVFYCIEGGSIVVIGVMHGSRNPRSWKRRI